MEEIPEGTFPINFKLTQRYQRSEPSLMAKYKNSTYHTDYFCGGINDDISLIMCKVKKIFR